MKSNQNYEKDIYLKNKFYNLEEIRIGNIINEEDLFKNFLDYNAFPKTLTSINIVSFNDFYYGLSKLSNAQIRIERKKANLK